MAELDFERKHAEDLQRLRGFRLLDDDFMSKVFEDKACSQFLLQIILEKKDLIVQKVHAQHDVKNLQGRSIRLDIIAIDEGGRVYNIDYSDFRFIPINVLRYFFCKISKQIYRNNYFSNLVQAVQ